MCDIAQTLNLKTFFHKVSPGGQTSRLDGHQKQIVVTWFNQANHLRIITNAGRSTSFGYKSILDWHTLFCYEGNKDKAYRLYQQGINIDTILLKREETEFVKGFVFCQVKIGKKDKWVW